MKNRKGLNGSGGERGLTLSAAVDSVRYKSRNFWTLSLLGILNIVIRIILVILNANLLQLKKKLEVLLL